MHEKFNRDAAGQQHPIIGEQKNDLLQYSAEIEQGLLSLYRDREHTIQELKDLKPMVLSLATTEQLPVALSTLLIQQASGYVLRNAANTAFEQGKLDAAILFDDMAEGIIGTTQGAFVASTRLTHIDHGEILSETMKIIQSIDPNLDALKVTTRLAKEETLQADLLKKDPTGHSLIDYWVMVTEEREEEMKTYPAKPERISAFVIRGAHIARKIYQVVYPLSKGV